MHCSTNQGVQIACGLFLSLLVSLTFVPSGLNKDDLYKRKKYKQEREVKHVLFTHFFHVALNWNFVSTLLLCWFVTFLGGKFSKKTAKEAPSDFYQKQHLYIYIYLHIYILCIHVYTYIYICVTMYVFFNITIFTTQSSVAKTKSRTLFNIGSFRFPYVFPPSKGCLVWRWCTH